VALLRGDGTAITKDVSTEKMRVDAGQMVPFVVKFTKEDFLQDHKGTLDFRAAWGAKDTWCMKAGVKDESLLLRNEAGAVVMAMTKGGTKTDGSAGGKCHEPDAITKSAESVENLPWGLYRLSVFTPDKAYCGTQHVFVLPGIARPTYDVIAMKQMPPPDGGVADGGATDGGTMLSCP
jgi:hypothetical protein